MLIRCSRCHAVWSLQDGVVVASGFKVECGRCLQQFTAEPPRRAVPPAPAVQTPAPAITSAPPPNAVERKVTGEELAKALREPRLEDALLEVSNRRRRRTVLIGAFVVLAAAAVAAWQLGFAGPPKAVREKVARAGEKLLRDDFASVESAVTLLTEAVRAAPSDAGIEGERGFALLLQAAAHKDLAARVEAEREQHQRDATRLMQEGVAAAKSSLDDDAENPWGLRAMALYCALSQAPERGRRYLGDGEKAAPLPWDALVRALLGEDPPAQLSAALQKEPRMLRASVELAALALDKQESGAARTRLDEVLKANPQHERAKRLAALLPAEH